MTLRCAWEVLRDIGFVLWPLRMIVLSLVVVGAAVLALPQAQEIFVKLGQDPHLADWVLFVASTSWLAINAWYWARFITGVQGTSPFERLPLARCGTPGCGGYPWFGGQPARLRFLANHLPRVLGFAVVLMVGAALGVASTKLPKPSLNAPHPDTRAQENLILASIAFGIAAFAFYEFL